MNCNGVYPAERAVCTNPSRLAADHTGRSRYDKILLMEETAAVFRVHVREAGAYRLEFSYSAVRSDLGLYLLVNGVRFVLFFGNTRGGWDLLCFPVALTAGENRIALESIGPEREHAEGALYMESLALRSWNTGEPERLYTLPVVSPCRNIHYKAMPGQLEYHVLHPGTLRGVTAGGAALPFARGDRIMADGDLRFLPQESVAVDTQPLSAMEAGNYHLALDYGEETAVSLLTVRERPAPAGMTITFLDVGHGCSVLFRLPDGAWMLVDSGYDYMARERVIPFLRANGIEILDYYLITHYDPDHMGEMDRIREEFRVRRFLDCRSFRRGEAFSLCGADWTILNARVGVGGANENSVSFRMAYNGFVYVHGGDIYARQQGEIREELPEAVRCHIYHANHHFFGSLDPYYLRKCNPYLFVMGVNVHCYTKHAHLRDFREDVEDYLKSNQGRLIETLRTFQTGNTTIRIRSGKDFTYECYRDNAGKRML